MSHIIVWYRTAASRLLRLCEEEANIKSLFVHSLVPLAFLCSAARWSETVFVFKVKSIAVLLMSLTLFGCALYFYEMLLVGFCHFLIRAVLQWEVCAASAGNFSQWSPEILQDLTFAAVLRSPEEVFFSVHLRDYPAKCAPKRIWKINWSGWIGSVFETFCFPYCSIFH